ncbi:MAG: signal peptidase I [Nitrococcus sp.]|nr:signal peptidase I [Nitrococcus sp.]
MYFDFEALLVLLTFLTGAVWLWDRWGRQRQVQRRGDGAVKTGEKVSWWVDLARSLFPVILAVLIIRSFIVEPFRIPSGSMIPTLLPGDFILVNKFSYGLQLPVLHTRIFGTGQPQRGDVAVFRYPKDPSQDYIKRIVGLPGDRIHYEQKKLYINGEPVPQELIGRYPPDPAAVVKIEHLEDADHEILLYRNALSGSFTFRVPQGAYFAMGDNRDRSSDSRYWGAVPARNLVGEAFLIWMSWDWQDDTVNWSRIGNAIN